MLDPACGSGAFLIAAFDYFMRQYEQVNQTLLALQHTPIQNIELDRTILSNNLFGVDISPESVEITKLSLWLKTAERGKTLTYLDNNIKVGNSIVDDAQLTNSPFNWQAEFTNIFAAGGFDVVIGNPPYVRQELLSAIKPYLQSHYDSYHGVADLYTYFYEKGLKILKPAGMLSYIVTNKWLRSGYGEPLRNFFSQQGVFEQIIDFGHAPIFEDADTFPCIVAVRKPNLDDSKQDACTTQDTRSQAQPRNEGLGRIEPGNVGLGGIESVLVCPVPREELNNINLTQYIKQNGYTIPWSRFNANAWSLEPPAVDDLMRKIQQVGIPLKDFAGVKPYRGITTGFNDAFLIDEATKNKLIQADSKSAEIIKPYLRGQDIKRWYSEWQNLWLIFTRRGINIDGYPAIKAYLNQYREQLEPRPKDWNASINGDWAGRKPGSYQWYEIQDSVDYWQLFETNKIIWKDLSTYSEFCFDDSGIFTNDLCFILTSSDKWLLAVLNSPLMWYYLHRVTIHAINETLRLKNIYTETLPIAPPTDEIRAEAEPIVSRLIEITKANKAAYRDVLDWLQIEYKIAKIGQKLENFATLQFPEFADEVRKRMPKSKSSDPLSPAAFKALRQAYNEYVPAIQTRKTEAMKLEYRLCDLVNCAYKLTPEEIDLMWKTAPPRMPITRL